MNGWWVFQAIGMAMQCSRSSVNLMTELGHVNSNQTPCSHSVTFPHSVAFEGLTFGEGLSEPVLLRGVRIRVAVTSAPASGGVLAS